jgi:hypothetical protein
MNATESDPDINENGGWAQVGPRLSVANEAHRAQARMVDGKLVSGPIQGFGKMWQKTYRVRLTGLQVAPANVIATWKARFPEFWPEGNRFYAPLTGIAPGEVALLDISLGPGASLSTGVLVLYADDESFTLMTPQGHVFCGWITFSSFVDGADGEAIAQAEVLMRAADPICELGLTFGGHAREDAFWVHTLTRLAEHLGVPAPEVAQRVVCVDSRRQWSRAANVWQNGAVRTGAYRATAPIRWAARLPRRAFGRRPA